jgi:hypothetical protein
MPEWQHFTIGLSGTILLGFLVDPLVKYTKRSIKSLPRRDIGERWEALAREPPYISPGFILGFLERILFFIALWSYSWQVIGGWLAFKLASKWETYKSIMFFPPKLEGSNDLDYLLARRLLGSQRLMTYLIGTIANVLFAISGVAIGRHGCELIYYVNSWL